MTAIQRNVSLKNFSSFRIGGYVKYFVEVKNLSGLIKALKLRRNKKIFVLGSGTNLLVSDKGFNGLVIYNRIKDIKILRDEDIRVVVGAGTLLADLLNFCIENSLSGLEWAGGLPGTIGGGVRGNAGAFGGEIKDNVLEVESLDINTFEIKKRKKKDCLFGYRRSIFKSESLRESKTKTDQEIIVNVILSFKKGNKKKIAREITEKIEYRKSRHPLEYPNIGSIFKNIDVKSAPKELAQEFLASIKNDPFPVLPTAKILAASGFKGRRVGDAQISEKHPNFIINLGHAKSQDVLKLITQIKKTIREKYGVTLEEEITYLN